MTTEKPGKKFMNYETWDALAFMGMTSNEKDSDRQVGRFYRSVFDSVEEFGIGTVHDPRVHGHRGGVNTEYYKVGEEHTWQQQ